MSKEFEKVKKAPFEMIEEEKEEEECKIQKHKVKEIFKNKENKKRHIKIAETLIVFTFISMLTMAVISIVFFVDQKNLFLKQKKSLEYASWPMTLRSIVSTELYYSQYIKFVDQDIFPGIKNNWQSFK